VRRILVIRLGALGDFVLSFSPFAAIRAHHAGAHVSLLTTPPFAEPAKRAPWFDAVLVDWRPSWWNLPGLWNLRSRLRGFDLVYDLQTSSRSSGYFVLAGRPQWSGIAPGCSLPHDNRGRDSMHTLERQRDQLAMAGIDEFPPPALDWLTEAPPRFELPERYAILVPGAAPHRAAKRWPAERFGALGKHLVARGNLPIVVGTRREAPLAEVIRRTCPEAVDLTGRTTITDIAAISARAAIAIGNDTGPMHLAAAVGCRSVVLFSAASDPALTAPRGPGGAWPIVLRAPSLASLGVDEVLAATGQVSRP
jgi:ADP-heptose:LPS heptosyltransferase